MWRSSQPKSGVSGACVADEKLLDLIAQSCVFYKRGSESLWRSPFVHY